MLHHKHQAEARRGLRRRAFMISLGGMIAAIDPTGLLADETNDETLGTKPAVHRKESTLTSQTIVLDPVSADFNGTIIQAIATDPRGEVIAVAGDDHAIRILDIQSLDVIQIIQGHSDLIQTMDFDPRGDRLVSSGNDGKILVWNRNRNFARLQQLGPTPPLACVRYSPDGKQLAAVGFRDEVFLIDDTKQPARPKVRCDCTDLRTVAYSHDGNLIAVAGRSGYLHLFDQKTGSLIGDFQIHSGRVHAAEFLSSTAIMASAGEDGRVVLFDTHAKKIVSHVQVSHVKLFALAWIDSQRLAVAGSDNLVRIVDVVLGKVVDELHGHTGSIAALAVTGGSMFTGGYDATLRRWKLADATIQDDRIAERDPRSGRE